MKRIVLTEDTAPGILNALNELKANSVVARKAIYSVLDPALIIKLGYLNDRSDVVHKYDGHTLEEPNLNVICSMTGVPVPCEKTIWAPGTEIDNAESVYEVLLKYTEFPKKQNQINLYFGNFDEVYFYENVVFIVTTQSTKPNLVIAFMFNKI
jgi:hypothetical protein